MSSPDSTVPFQVDLRGVVDLLSRHIYSGPHVFLRELLQNARDAAAARTLLDGTGSSPIRIVPAGVAGAEFTIVDEGIGLTRAEVGELLATVGRSSKRDVLGLRSHDFLGQFGIGLLSCFMVADDIVVRSRSARGGAPVEWVGSADGTFVVRELPDDAEIPVGTTVVLLPRPDEASLLSAGSITELAATFGEYLESPIRIRQEGGTWITITRRAVFAEPLTAETREDVLELGAEIAGRTPFDCIELSVPETQTRGVAFVLPYSPPPGSRQANRVYLGRMLLSERYDELLPDWAFFVRLCVDSTGLEPTASREQLTHNAAFEQTREALGAAIRVWLLELATSSPTRLLEFIGIHEVQLKALLASDDELARTVIPWLPVATSAGQLRLGDLIARRTTIRYAATIDEFRQLSAFATADSPIVNAGYVYDVDIMSRLPHLFDGLAVERVTVSGEVEQLETPSLADRDVAIALERAGTQALAQAGVEAVVRRFQPDDLPALYVVDQEILRAIERDKASSVASGRWRDVLGRVGDILTQADPVDLSRPTAAKLCLNWNSPVVRTLSTTRDRVVVDRSVQLLYIQSLLAGHRPLRPVDRSILTVALNDLIALSVGTDEGEL